ncbi:hypothetical protein FocTR4_00014996 [Fusarium oxysporum f. sp. cubense]|uniref:Uncharacterized protein n=1 Tax=Fusarium oxysporum f. sp. cubense TaxID=61366 RepID=A0A5C6SWD3_FUSOC|nr:hypothetical protein FocTR4_00014996 [Fusarium oxysporum f. sp. cubense]
MDQYITLHKKPSRAMSTVALTLAQSNLVRRHRDNTTDSRPHHRAKMTRLVSGGRDGRRQTARLPAQRWGLASVQHSCWSNTGQRCTRNALTNVVQLQAADLAVFSTRVSSLRKLSEDTEAGRHRVETRPSARRSEPFGLHYQRQQLASKCLMITTTVDNRNLDFI